MSLYTKLPCASTSEIWHRRRLPSIDHRFVPPYHFHEDPEAAAADGLNLMVGCALRQHPAVALLPTSLLRVEAGRKSYVEVPFPFPRTAKLRGFVVLPGWIRGAKGRPDTDGVFRPSGAFLSRGGEQCNRTPLTVR